MGLWTLATTLFMPRVANSITSGDQALGNVTNLGQSTELVLGTQLQPLVALPFKHARDLSFSRKAGGPDTMRKLRFFWNTGNFSHLFPNMQTLSLQPPHSREKAVVHSHHQVLLPGEFPKTKTTSSLKTSPSPHHLGPQSTPTRASSVLRYMLVYPRPLPRPSLPVRKRQSPLFLPLENVDFAKCPFSVGNADQYGAAGAAVSRGHHNKWDSLPCGPSALPAAHLPGSCSPSHAPSHLGHLCPEQHTCPSDDRSEQRGRTRS